MNRRTAIALLVASASGAQWSAKAQSTVRREGGQWILKATGKAEAKAVVKVIVPGSVRVIPSKTGFVTFHWEERVNSGRGVAAESPGASPVRIKSGPDYCVLSVPEEGRLGPGQLLVEIPAKTKKLFVESSSGSLKVEDIASEVQAATAGGSVEMDSIGGSVVARTGGGSMIFGRIDGSLRCLSGGGIIRAGRIAAEAVLESAGGEVFVDEVGGTLRVSTAGNIHVGRAASTVAALTSSGSIEVIHAGGMVTAETTSGGITVGSAPGVRCESAGGTIRLKEMSGSVRASTASGHLFVGMASGKELENAFLASGRGDITVFLPSNLAVTVKALNESGGWINRFVSDFPEIRSRPSAMTGGGGRMVVEGSLNGGGPMLLLSVSNGGIYIKKR